jgi:hypothetical protein
MNARELAQALGGKRAGSCWMARCPAHDDREPSLAIRDGAHGRMLIRCHAGCGQTDVIAALRRRGLWEVSIAKPRFSGAMPSHEKERTQRSAAAIRIWNDCRCTCGTIIESYLVSRGLVVPATPRLRFHPGMKHPTGGTWPVMVALVTDVNDEPVGIHRTFLGPDGSGKAPVSPTRMSLGPIRGGAVRLAPVAERLAVGEGVETVLSVMQSTGLSGWAALSTSGMKTLVLPDRVKEVVVLADADPPGEAAAREASARWSREGRRVRIARPSNGCKDFNDALRIAADGRALRHDRLCG